MCLIMSIEKRHTIINAIKNVMKLKLRNEKGNEWKFDQIRKNKEKKHINQHKI